MNSQSFHLLHCVNYCLFICLANYTVNNQFVNHVVDRVWVKGKVCFFQLPRFFSDDTIENVNNNLNQVEYAKF